MMRFTVHRRFFWIVGIAIAALGGPALSASAQDSDGDGVPDAVDNGPDIPNGGPMTLTDPVEPDAVIPDGPPNCSAPGVAVARTINFPASGAILLDLDVALDIAHTWYGDVQVDLTHVATATGMTLLMRGNPDDSSDLNGVYTIDDEAAGTLDAAALAIVGGVIPPGSYQGEDLLSLFNGLDSQGDWELTITDWCTSDTGTLRSWSLTFTFDQPDTDGDGVVDPDDVCCNTPLGVDVDAQGRPIGDLDFDCDNDLEDFFLFSHGVTGPLSEPADCP